MFWLLAVTVSFAEPNEVAPLTLTDIEQPLEIDGVLNETVYEQAPLPIEFLEYVPNVGGPPPGKTEVWLFQDEKNLYLSARVSETDYKIRSHITPRERINFDDQIGFYISTFGDPREGYLFFFNPLGVQQDIRLAPNSFSFAWDTQMRSKGHVTEDGYELEVMIPFRSIKYPGSPSTQEWRVFVTRKVPETGASYSYPRVQRRHPRLFSLAAPLQNVKPSPGGSGLELIPSFTAQQYAEREDLTTPLRYTGLDPWTEAMRPALDARFGFTPNLGLTATINPDFSQIEADQTFIDLNQRFAFFLRERRPFFLDGNEYFNDVSESFYTRAINDPLYGLKVSGKEGQAAIGFLHLIDKSPSVTVHELDTPGFNEADIEDRVAINHIGRARIDTRNGGSVGFTGLDKRMFDPVAFQTTGEHTAAALDFSIPLPHEIQFQGATFQSWTGRPGERKLWGQENRLSVFKYSRVGTSARAEVIDRSTGLRKEMGFLNQSGLTAAEAEVYHTWELDGVLDRYQPGLEFTGQVERNGDGFQSVQINQRFIHNGVHGWDTNVGVLRTQEEGVRDLGWFAEVEYDSDWTHYASLEGGLSARRLLDYNRLKPAFIAGGNFELTLRPTAGLSWENTFLYERIFPEDADSEFATRWRSRLNWQFTRELGLRTIVEHTGGNAIENRLRSSVLLAWLLNPGTAAYIGYSETTQVDGKLGALERAVFGKFSVYWRP